MVKKEFIGTKVYVGRLNLEIEVCDKNEKELIYFGFGKYIEPVKSKKDDSVKSEPVKLIRSNTDGKRKSGKS